jgi:hypothetical protein
LKTGKTNEAAFRLRPPGTDNLNPNGDQTMNETPKQQPIIFVYGLSGSGKTKLVLSQPALFDRACVAVHGHPEEYGGMALAHVFGHETPSMSDSSVFSEMLNNPGIKTLVIDDARLAESSFGHEFHLRITNSGKAGLVLVQSFDEARRMATFLNACKVDSSLVPATHRNIIPGICFSLSANPAETEAW